MQQNSIAMLKNLLYIILGGVLFLTSCRSQMVTVATTPTPDTTVLPTFPAEVLYVLGARWEADTVLQQKQSMDNYIEQELIRLYPNKAYEGYIHRICVVVDGLLRAETHPTPSFYHHPKQEIRFAEAHHSHSMPLLARLDSTAIDDEMHLMALTPQEQAHWDQLQHLVHTTAPLTPEAFDTLNMDFFEEEDLLTAVLLWRGPRFFYRILQSKARAEQLSRYYYGDATNNGRPGDAFKHIYVNVLLRTYVGEWVTHLIMDLFWEWKSPNAPCDYYMDLHNNIVGRVSRYNDFTTFDAQASDTPYWLQWAENVQHFVQDSVNGHRQGWDKETPTFIVEPAAKQVDEQQYIYWDK